MAWESSWFRLVFESGGGGGSMSWGDPGVMTI